MSLRSESSFQNSSLGAPNFCTELWLSSDSLGLGPAQNYRGQKVGTRSSSSLLLIHMLYILCWFEHPRCLLLLLLSYDESIYYQQYLLIDLPSSDRPVHTSFLFIAVTLSFVSFHGAHGSSSLCGRSNC